MGGQLNQREGVQSLATQIESLERKFTGSRARWRDNHNFVVIR